MKQIFDTYRKFSKILSYLKVKIRKSPAGYKDFLSFFVCAHFNSLLIFFLHMGAPQNVKGSHANLETVKFRSAGIGKTRRLLLFFRSQIFIKNTMAGLLDLSPKSAK